MQYGYDVGNMPLKTEMGPYWPRDVNSSNIMAVARSSCIAMCNHVVQAATTRGKDGVDHGR